jgi:CubicO group peptidase (beta-lactamase class C family)
VSALCIVVVAALACEPSAYRPRTRVSIGGGRWHLGGRPTYPGSPAEGLLLNVRMVNAVFEDGKRPGFAAGKNTEAFVRRLPDYVAAGVRAVTLNLQGGMPGYEGAVNSAFAPDGSLRPAYLRRVGRVIEACDRLGCAVILGCFYQRQDQVLTDDAAVRRGVREVAAWLKGQGYTNVLLEIANEFNHPGFDHTVLRAPKGQAELIRLARKGCPGLLVSTSGLGDGKLPDEVARASDFLLVHFNGTPVEAIPARLAALRKYAKPIVCNEDSKLGVAASPALGACVANGASWGFMHEKRNQHVPPRFDGSADDPVVYARLRVLSTPAVFPGKDWATRKPEALGLDAAALTRFYEAVGGRGCVVRHGCLAGSWGDAARPGDVASAAKPVYAHFLWKALEEKKIPGLDEAVVKYRPALAGLNKALGFKDRRITWRHLATQTSCYGVAERPGEAFDYSDYQMALFWDLLFGEVYRAAPERVDALVLRPELVDGLGCQDRVSMLAFGSKDRPGRLSISPRDFARFGQLYLREGAWAGKRLLPAAVVRRATGTPLGNALPRTKGRKAEMLPGQRSIGGGNNQTDHLGSYSYLWWTNGIDRAGGRHWPDLPEDAYAALGHGGRRGLLVVPSLDLVASWNDARIDGRASENRVLRLLTDAVRRGDR